MSKTIVDSSFDVPLSPSYHSTLKIYFTVIVPMYLVHFFNPTFFLPNYLIFFLHSVSSYIIYPLIDHGCCHWTLRSPIKKDLQAKPFWQTRVFCFGPALIADEMSETEVESKTQHKYINYKTVLTTERSEELPTSVSETLA